jgi:cytochrome c biogenesis protein CcdA
VNDLTLALAAGLVAAVNPCGFALLPAYLAMLLADPDGAPRLVPRPAAIARALRLTAAMTAAFGGYGLVAGAVATAVQPVLPWVSVAGGVLLVGAGALLAAGRHLPLRIPLPRCPGPGGSVLSLAIYGAWYATPSLSCTIAPFLAVTAAAIRSGGQLRAAAIFGAYALGMGLVVGVLCMTVTLTRSALAGRSRAVLPYVSRAGGILLLGAGSYVACYGWYELGAAGSAAHPVITAAAGMQQHIAAWITGIGPLRIAVAFCLLAVAGALLATVRCR